MSQVNRSSRKPLTQTAAAVFEKLETRQLMSAAALPFRLDFDGTGDGSILDRNGYATGFDGVQANKYDNQYQPELIDMDAAAGILKLTSTGSAAAGSNAGTDNTQVNALESTFDATTNGFAITTRLIGPLSNINTAYQQAGVYFGPDQDNFIKLVAVDLSSTGGGQYLQFKDETNTGSGPASSLADTQNRLSIGNFASISTLDLRLVGNASTGTVAAYYSVNGGSFNKISFEYSVPSSKRAAFFGTSAKAGILVSQKNDAAPITTKFDSFEITGGSVAGVSPSITGTRPADGSTGFSRDGFIAADVNLPNVGQGVDSSTLTETTVKLYRQSDGLAVAGNRNSTGGGDAIVFQPTGLLDPNTTYVFEVTSGVKDASGAAFTPWKSTFTTGTTGGTVDSTINFTKTAQTNTSGKRYTSLQMGPDGKLYSTTIDGKIIRFDIADDGTLGAGQEITTITDFAGTRRTALSIVFDPASTADNLIAYVSTGDFAGLELKEYNSLNLGKATQWSGRIVKLTGANLQTAQNLVVGLPRSVKDHQTYQMNFGPDGKLYVSQASMNAMGAPDNAWGQKAEVLLSGAILQINVTAIGTGTVNVQTEGLPAGQTAYNPLLIDAPVKIYATGLRSAYDVLFHSNGHLYSGTNGSAAGGNTPAKPGVAGTGLSNVSTEDDFFFDVVSGGYYGHPNPTRGEYILNGGNPTAGVDAGEITPDASHTAVYPVGTLPEASYKGYAYDFGKNYSPNGMIEYKGDAFGGALNGKILIVRYSGGDDVIAMTPSADGSTISAVQENIGGLSGFVNPLDLVEDQRNGNVYIAEFGDQAQIPGAEARITLLKPQSVTAPTTGTPVATVSRTKVYLSDYVSSTGAGSAQTIRVTNSGTGTLVISAANFTGSNAGEFSLVNPITTPISIPAGGKYDFYVNYTATNDRAIRTASLSLITNAAATPTINVALRAMGLQSGAGGNLEPSLQQILNLFQIPVNVGDATPDTTDFQPDTSTSVDEVTMPRLVKSGTAPITIEVLGAFANLTANTTLGWYEAGNSQTKNLLATVPVASNQSVAPLMDGAFTFDPGSNAFGLYGNFTLGSTTNPLNRDVFSENALNTWETNTSRQKKVRFYKLRDSAGNVVPDAYVFAFEEYNVTFDQNDVVGIIRNVKPAAEGPELGLENLDKVPFADRLTFNRITNLDKHLANSVHDTATLRVRNTGSQDLNISGMALSNSDFVFVSGNGAQTIAPGAYADVVVKFVYTRTGNGNEQRDGTLTITSNDSDEATKTVALSGVWQSYSENQPNGTSAEPVAQTVINALGYKVNLTSAGQSINTTGVATKVGEEIMSELWQRADTGLPVQTRQLAAYHQQWNAAYTTQSSLSWYNPTNLDSAGRPKVTTLFSHAQVDSQSLLPRLNGNLNLPAAAAFNPGTITTFGFATDGAKGTLSEDQYNTPNDANNAGHGWRFYQAKDASGKIIPDTYLAVQDYVKVSYANYDYQDNIYLISNVKPASRLPAPTNFVATGGNNGNALSWKANTEGNVTGYNLYASDSAGGTFVKINDAVITATSYLDTSAPAGVTRFYQLVAATYQGQESTAATASATRTGSGTTVTPPSAPSNLVATAASATQIGLTWTDTSSNEAGFKVERRTGSGAYSLLVTTAANVSSFTDNTAAPSTSYTYRISATNNAGDSVVSNETTAVTPANTALSSVDIGNPTPPGTVTTVTPGSDYDVSVGGLDIYNTSDQFNFVYQQRTGDFDVRVQVSELIAADPQSMAGLMARESLNANSRNVMIKARPSDYRMSYRTSTAGSTTAVGTGAGTTAVPKSWVRLQRVGNVFTTYGSADGTTWTQVGTATLTVGTTVFVGMATSAHTTTAAATARYRNFGDTAAPLPGSASNLTATAPSATTAQLTWQDNSTNETGFKLERRQGNGAWQQIATLGQNVVTYTDSGLAAATTYSYRVLTYNAAGTAPESNTATITTPAVPTTQTLAPVADAVVRSGAYAGTNFPTDTTYLVKQSTGDNARQIFMKFDATTAGNPDSLASIKLRVSGRLTGSAAGTVPVGVYGVTDESWTENGVTYNNRPATGASAIASFPVTNLAADQWFEIDVTAYVKAQLAAGKTSVSFNFRATASTTPGGQFNSRESGAATAPQLVITANGPAPTPVPAAASNLVATASGQTSVGLAWQDNSTTETGFRIERSTAGGAYTILTTVGSDVAAYTDNSVVANTHYDYRVIAFNGTGDAASSNVSGVTTPAAPTPVNVSVAASADAVVRGGSYKNINYGGEANYFAKLASADNTREIFIKFDIPAGTDAASLASVKLQLFGRATGSAATSVPVTISGVADQTWTESGVTYANEPSATGSLATVNVNNITTDQLYEIDLTAYVKQQIVAGATSVSFKLQASAVTSAGAQFNSRESGAATAPTLVLTTNTVTPPPPATTPTAASNLVATATSSTSVSLAWQDNAANETGTRIERSTAGAAYATLATLAADVTAYVDSTVVAGTHYDYRVVAFNATGDAPASNVAGVDTAVTPPPTTSVTFNSAADGYVRPASGLTTTNYASDVDLMVKKASADTTRIAYVTFDLAAYTGTPTNIKLRLYGNLTAASANGLTMGVYAVGNTGWTEAGLTYATRPAASGTPLTTTTVTSTTASWIEIDLTAYVRAELAAGHTSVSFAFQGTNTTSEALRINSKEAASNAPQLVVT